MVMRSAIPVLAHTIVQLIAQAQVLRHHVLQLGNNVNPEEKRQQDISGMVV
jgi:hypothetical protein